MIHDVTQRLGVTGDRDFHLLLPARSSSVLVVDCDDGATAAAVAAAGHDVIAALRDPSTVPMGCVGAVALDGDWGGGYDAVLLCSPHRWADCVAGSVDRAAAARDRAGYLVVVDRPSGAWPDLLGRRDPVTGRRLRHGAVSARSLLDLVARQGPVDAVMAAAPHDRALRTIVPLSWNGHRVERAPVGHALRDLLQEAGLPGGVATPLLDRAPRRLVESTLPVIVVMSGPEAAGRSRLDELLSSGRGIAYVGSAQSPVCTTVSLGEAPNVRKTSYCTSWRPAALVDVAGAVSTSADDSFLVAEHRLDADARVVRVGWLDGDRPGPRHVDALAETLGILHRRTGAGTASIADTTLAQGRIRLGDLIEQAVTVAPQLAEYVAPLREATGPTALVHGDWGRRNARIVNGRVAMFDLDLADTSGSPAYDIGWFLIRESTATRATVTAYEAASGRKVSVNDLAAGLVGVATRYGARAAIEACRKVPDLLSR